MLPASAALIADTGHWLGLSHSLPGGVVPLSRSNCYGATEFISGKYAIQQTLDHVEIHGLIQ